MELVQGQALELARSYHWKMLWMTEKNLSKTSTTRHYFLVREPGQELELAHLFRWKMSFHCLVSSGSNRRMMRHSLEVADSHSYTASHLKCKHRKKERIRHTVALGSKEDLLRIPADLDYI